jgi:hypothetical protein
VLSISSSCPHGVLHDLTNSEYGGGGDSGGGGDGLLIDAVSGSNNITSNDGIMHNKFARMLKEAVMAKFKNASNVTGYKERLQALQFERPKL